MTPARPKKEAQSRVAVAIRALEPDKDVAAIAELFRCPKVVAGTLQMPMQSDAEIRARLAEPPPGMRRLVAEVEGRVVALGSLIPGMRARRRHVADIGMMVHDDFQGRGVGGRLLDALLSLGDSWMEVLRYELEVYVDNYAAIQLYASRGFVVEGVLRGFALRDGSLVDTFRMARVSSKLPWPRITAEDAAKRTPPRLPPGPDRGRN